MEQELRKKNLDFMFAIFRESLKYVDNPNLKNFNSKILEMFEAYSLKKFKLKCAEVTFN